MATAQQIRKGIQQGLFTLDQLPDSAKGLLKEELRTRGTTIQPTPIQAEPIKPEPIKPIVPFTGDEPRLQEIRQAKVERRAQQAERDRELQELKTRFPDLQFKEYRPTELKARKDVTLVEDLTPLQQGKLVATKGLTKKDLENQVGKQAAKKAIQEYNKQFTPLQRITEPAVRAGTAISQRLVELPADIATGVSIAAEGLTGGESAITRGIREKVAPLKDISEQMGTIRKRLGVRSQAEEFVFDKFPGVATDIIAKGSTGVFAPSVYITSAAGSAYDNAPDFDAQGNALTDEQKKDRAAVIGLIVGPAEYLGDKLALAGFRPETGAKGAIKNIVTAALGEGVSGTTESLLTDVYDNIVGIQEKEQSEVVKDALASGLEEAIIGGIFRGLGDAAIFVDSRGVDVSPRDMTIDEIETAIQKVSDLSGMNTEVVMSEALKGIKGRQQQIVEEAVTGIRPQVPQVTAEQVTPRTLVTAEQPMQPMLTEDIAPTTKIPSDIRGEIKLPLDKKETIQKVKFITPEINERYETAKGIPVKGIAQKVKDYFVDLSKKATRQFKDLPLTEQTSEAIKDINLMLKSRQRGGAETTRFITDITKNLTNNEADLFTKKVLIDDLAFDAQDGKKLPLGFNLGNIFQEQQNINNNITHEVQVAVDKRNAIWNNIKDQYAQAMNELGIDTEGRFTKPNYFRHQVLKHMDESTRIKGLGQKAGIKQRAFTKQRKGTTEDINTNYIQAEYEVMAQMLSDIETAKRLSNIQKNYDITDELQQRHGDKYLENIPDGYVEFAPSGENVFLNKNIEDDLRFLSETLAEELGTDNIKIKPQKTMILPEGVAATLSDLGANKEKTLMQKGISFWKRLMLTDIPTKLLRYNARNMAGDADAVLAGRAGTFKKVPEAVREINAAAFNGKFTPEFQEFIDRGGDQITFIAQELQELSKAPEFKKFFKKPEGILDKGFDLAKAPFRAYRNFADTLTNNREMIFRYAAYKQFKQEMQQNANNLPNDYAMSNPEAIKGLKTIEDRAFKMSNDMLGNYDEITELGKDLRQNLVPFYSFTEANAKRYINLFKNAWNNPQAQLEAGNAVAKNAKVAGVLSVKAARKLGGIALKAYAFTGLTTLWNNIFFRDEEEDLPQDVKERPHLIFGRDKNGNVLYFSRLGSLSEALEIFGLDTASQDVIDILNGNKTLGEQAKDIALAPAKKVISGVGPQYKVPFETLSGQALYPDPFTPRPIRDKAENIARTFGIDSTYRLLVGKPSEGYLTELAKKSLLYSANPNQTAYWKTKALVDKFNEEKTGNKRTTGSFSNKKSDALYELKKAIRFDDEKAKIKYIKKYIEAGGTIKGLETSMRSLDPLNNLAQKNIDEFKKSLTKDELEDLRKAQQYNKDILGGPDKTKKTLKENRDLKELKRLFNKHKIITPNIKAKTKKSILPLLKGGE